MGELALTEEIKTLGLEKYAEELERDGLTIVPPEVNGFGVDRIDEIVELILARAREMTGCTFTLDGGPQQELEFPKRERTPKQLERRKALGRDADELNLRRGRRGRRKHPKTQFLIQKLTQQHRLFRNLALNPASLALQNFMMAGRPHGQQHVVPHRVHARRRGPGLGSWLAQGGQTRAAPGAGQGCHPCRGAEGVGHRVARGDLARRVSAQGGGAATRSRGLPPA